MHAEIIHAEVCFRLNYLEMISRNCSAFLSIRKNTLFSLQKILAAVSERSLREKDSGMVFWPPLWMSPLIWPRCELVWCSYWHVLCVGAQLNSVGPRRVGSKQGLGSAVPLQQLGEEELSRAISKRSVLGRQVTVPELLALPAVLWSAISR